jgi:hypothetical protein
MFPSLLPAFRIIHETSHPMLNSKPKKTHEIHRNLLLLFLLLDISKHGFKIIVRGLIFLFLHPLMCGRRAQIDGIAVDGCAIDRLWRGRCWVCVRPQWIFCECDCFLFSFFERGIEERSFRHRDVDVGMACCKSTLRPLKTTSKACR